MNVIRHDDSHIEMYLAFIIVQAVFQAFDHELCRGE